MENAICKVTKITALHHRARVQYLDCEKSVKRTNYNQVLFKIIKVDDGDDSGEHYCADLMDGIHLNSCYRKEINILFLASGQCFFLLRAL